MRFRPLLLLLPALLGACSKTATPVQLDFIGTPVLTSGNKTVNPNDTLTTRAYAVGNDNALTRLRITVKYEPTRNPLLYPVPLSGYDPKSAVNDDELVYLDSLVTPITRTSTYTSPYRGGEYLFQNQFSARSTSGTELWQYTIYDDAGQSASRAYRLTVRKPDSAAVFHNYTAAVRPVLRRTTADSAQFRDRARIFLNLRSGLLLPKYAVINNQRSLQANQQLVDLVCVIQNSAISLNAPTDASILRLKSATWPVANRRATQLRSTALSATAFASATTTAAFTAAFAGGTAFANPFSTGTLTKTQVVAFQISENNQTYTGLILVSDLVLGTSPILTCAIKVQK